MTDRLAVFDTTLRESNRWLNQVAKKLPGATRRQAYAAVRTVIHVLRDRLPMEAVAGVSAQLPMLLRGLFLEGWSPNKEPLRIRDPEELAAEVAARLPHAFPYDPVMVIEAVIGVMSDHLDPGETQKLMDFLPAPLRTYWPADYRGAPAHHA